MCKPELLYWYWTITGGLLGFGLLSLQMGIGRLCLFVGLAMCLGGTRFLRARHSVMPDGPLPSRYRVGHASPARSSTDQVSSKVKPL